VHSSCAHESNTAAQTEMLGWFGCGLDVRRSQADLVAFGVADFPQCSGVNGLDLVLGPFGPFPVVCAGAGSDWSLPGG
jgi:hypothetical protein